MNVRQLIPELARVLAGLELSRLSDFDCVEVLKAQYRQANHERARGMAAMAEVGVRSSPPRRRCMPAPVHIPTFAELSTRPPGQNIRDRYNAVKAARDAHYERVQVFRRRSEVAGKNLSKSDERAYRAHLDQVEDLAELLETIGESAEAREIDYNQVISASGAPTFGGDGDARALVLGPEQRVADWAAARGGVRDEHRDLSLGAMLRGWLTSRWGRCRPGAARPP